MRNVVGFAIVLLGVGFLLNQMGVTWADKVASSWWPLLIIGFGLVSLQKNPRGWFGPVIVVLVGVVLLISQLVESTRSLWAYFWPIIIILIGGRILLQKKWDERVTTAGNANAHVLFSGVDRKVTGKYENSEISAAFGGVKLDLREAEFGENQELNVFAAFGGVELLVPKTVRVVTHVSPLFGGVEDKTQSDAAATQTLNIKGTALFGGIEVKN